MKSDISNNHITSQSDYGRKHTSVNPFSSLAFLIPVFILTALGFWLAFNNIWFGDSLGYRMKIPYEDVTPTEPVRTLGDVAISQYHGYLHDNGRMFCHFIVQALCTFVPRPVFAVLNALVWIAFLMVTARLAVGKNHRLSSGASLILLSLVWISVSELEFTPPFQVNYIWMGALVFGFLILFFNDTEGSPLKHILFGIFAFLAGLSNESISLPVALSLLIFLIHSKFKVTHLQWTEGLAFASGTIIMCLAPGNFIRMGMENSLLNGILMILPVAWIGLIPIGVYLWLRLSHRATPQPTSLDRALWWILIFSYGISAVLKFSSGQRMLTAGNLAAVIISVRLLSDIKISMIWSALASLAALVAINFAIHREMVYNAKCLLIEAGYAASPTGLVYLSDDLYSYQYRNIEVMKDPWTYMRQLREPSAPGIHILPLSAESVSLPPDSNASVQFLPQGWILYQSLSDPKEFEIDKTLLPGILNRRMSPRKVEFTKESSILVDSTPTHLIGIYINDRDHLITSSISIK